MVKNMTKRLFGIVLMMMLMTTLSLKVYAGPVTVKGGITNGTVAVDKATANPGETVTITVTPANGFYTEKSDVKAEKTIDGGSAQAPGLKAGNPGVGSFVDIQGDAPADISGVATYTFTMPEAPYGVQVSAEFHECTPITQAMFNSIAEQEFSGQQITPAVQCADGYNLVLGTDYTVEYGENVGPGMNAGTVTITGKNKYTGTALLYFTIFRETYEIRWGQGNPWDSQHVIAMTKGADGKWVAANQEMAATIEFKVVKKREAGETTDTWYGAPGNDNYWINAGTLNTEIQLYEGNQNLYFPNSGTYTFTFDPATNKLVVSGEIIYNVTVADGIQNGTVVANPTSGKAGDPITITATANPGYKLQHLYINGEQVSATDNEDGTYTYNLTMPAADVTVGAEFSRKMFYITKAQTENGSFNISMNSGFMGDEVEIYPSPADGYIVDQVTVTAQDGTPVQVDNWVDRYHFVMPASNVTVTVTFRALTISYEIHWGITPEGSTSWAEDHVIPMTKRDDGGWVAINQAMPDCSEFKVVKKSQDGDNAPVLTWYGAQADGMYWITPDKLGTNISLYENTPNLYFPKTGVYTFTFDPSNNTLVVTGDMLYNITVAETTNGTATTNPDGPVAAGTEVTIVPAPAEGYEVDSITVTYGENQTVVVTDNKFVMPAADVTVNVSFKAIQYVLEGVTFTANRHWATYYNGTRNLALPESIQAYVVNSVVNDAVDITEIDHIPAGVGVLLYCEAAAEQVFTTPYTGSTGTYTSKLVGSDEAQTITEGYVLYNDTFIRSEEGTVAAHRCYLPTSQVAGAPRILKIGASDVPTAIESIIAQGNVAGINYVNLSGMTSSEPWRGVNIAVITFTDGTTRTVKVIK
jgi:uncharacterized protein (DUF2141 family)/archaellum component FlaG (FlaF/FlaG flagellin family)